MDGIKQDLNEAIDRMTRAKQYAEQGRLGFARQMLLLAENASARASRKMGCVLSQIAEAVKEES